MENQKTKLTTDSVEFSGDEFKCTSRISQKCLRYPKYEQKNELEK